MLQSFILSKNSQRYSCSAINYLSDGINILVGDDSVPVKFRPIDRHRPPNRKKYFFENECLISTV